MENINWRVKQKNWIRDIKSRLIAEVIGWVKINQFAFREK